MKRYWTADLHFGHADITVHSNRPTFRESEIVWNENGWDWISPETCATASVRADEFNIRAMNSRIKEDDIVIHNGDFLNYGSVKGHIGLKNKPKFYIDKLNGSWTLLSGNHDACNGVKTVGRHLLTTMADYKVFVSHFPTDHSVQDPELIAWVSRNCAFAICGHVHGAWQTKWVYTGNGNKFLNINVGVDVNRYKPLHDAEILEIYVKAVREWKTQ